MDTSGRDSAAPPVHVLLVEDDEGDAVLVKEWLSEVSDPIELTWVRTLADAEAWRGPLDCVLLDLGLPDAFGLDGLKRMQAGVHRVAVVVLTGYDDARHGVAAVAAGAQDYVIKGQASGELLARTIRYAVQRRRAESAESALLEERLRASENTRLERGLLPRPLVRDPAISVTSRYRSGGQRMLLGGDFYDVVEDGHGALHVLIGDVAGHGPDQAALGVALRIAWRTMTLAGRPESEILPIMGEVLVHERHDPVIFATVCTLTIAPDRRTASVFLAGHPAPLLRSGNRCVSLPQRGGPALGLVGAFPFAPVTVSLPVERWDILLYTDGAIDGRLPDTDDRLGVDGLARLVDDIARAVPHFDHDAGPFLDALIGRIAELNGGPLSDDLAMLRISVTAP
ncbi:MAG TPA: SpoIIE family protein phosphatase [Micromonosporaceae bacterium]|jgi:serine phosphatase RsbU (regulator of sigma subunit)